MYGRENEERRERGEVDRERKHEKRKEESDGAQGLLFFFIYGGVTWALADAYAWAAADADWTF